MVARGEPIAVAAGEIERVDETMAWARDIVVLVRILQRKGHEERVFERVFVFARQPYRDDIEWGIAALSELRTSPAAQR